MDFETEAVQGMFVVVKGIMERRGKSFNIYF